MIEYISASSVVYSLSLVGIQVCKISGLWSHFIMKYLLNVSENISGRVVRPVYIQRVFHGSYTATQTSTVPSYINECIL